MNAPDRLVTHLISSFFFLSSLGLSFAKLNGNGNGNGNMALPCSVPPEAGGWLWHTYIHTYLLLAGRLQMAATPFDTLPNNHGIASKFQFQVHLLGGGKPYSRYHGDFSSSCLPTYLHTGPPSLAQPCNIATQAFSKQHPRLLQLHPIIQRKIEFPPTARW